jgi:hypothetical protein
MVEAWLYGVIYQSGHLDWAWLHVVEGIGSVVKQQAGKLPEYPMYF